MPIFYLLIILTGLSFGMTSDDVLVGPFSRDKLKESPHQSWFLEGYEEYQVNDKRIKQLKNLSKDLEVHVFLGTWCPDSREHVPHFFKIADELDWRSSGISLYGLNKEKTSPSGKEEEYDVAYVPTFILKKDGKAIGRIVESPEKSLEADMVELLRSHKEK